jgi:hypothetical protein
MQKIDTDVGKLVSMIEDGELQLPEMQRRHVWPATRVRDLLDSLYRGYPSGAILVWETDLEMPSRELAVDQERSPFKGHKLLLDGQQRLTSLTAVLRGTPVTVRNRKKGIDILFNLAHPEGLLEVIEVNDDTTDSEGDGNESDDQGNSQNLQQRLNQRTFVVENSALSSDPRWVSVSDVFTGRKTDAQILRPLVNSLDDPLFEKYSKRLQSLRKIREYPYVMHVLDKSLSYEEVAEIFVRVNSLGMKLRGSDLALAQITSRWQNSLSLFEEFQNECEEGGFNADLGVLVRALVVFATGQSRFKTVGTIPVEKLKQGWTRAKEGLRFAINFLHTNARIENETLLSSPLFLISVAYYGSRKQFSLAPGEETSLRKWLYIANARGHYSASSETVLDSDLSIIREDGDLISALEHQLGRLRVEPADFVGRGKQSALFAMAYLALKARGAKDWRSQLELSLAHQGDHSIEYHHIFPRRALKKAGYDSGETNEIANMAFIAGGTNRSLSATPASQYLAEVLQKQGKEALESHCIPIDPALWELDGYRRFLEFRRAALAQAINEFINLSGQGHEIDVAAIVADGETDVVEFKSSARWDYKANSQNKSLENVIVKTIAGLLNGKGGTLLIGVDDEGEIVGLEQDYQTLSTRPDRDGYQQFLVNLLSSSLGKDVSASLSISVQSVNGRDVCAIQVPKSGKGVYVRDGQQTRFFLRTGNTTQELNTKETVDYIAKHWQQA